MVARIARAKDIVDAALAIPDRESGWLLPAICAGIAARVRGFRPDVIYSSAPPWTGQLVAAGLRQILRRPWVADFRDPWSRAPWRGDRYPFAMRAAARLERFVVGRADRIVFVAAGNRDAFTAQYGAAAAAKFDVVSNGCDPAEFDALRGIAPPADGPFVLLHAGSLYAGRTPVPLFNAVALAIRRGTIDRARVRVRFLGANAMRAVDLPAVCRQLGIADVVEFLPRVSREESLRAMMRASALLLLQPGHTVSVPGKVYEYLATGRPMLAIAEEGEISELVTRSGAGVFVRPDDEAGIAAALPEVIRMATGAVDLPRRELFDGNLGAARIAGILERVVGVGGLTPDFAGAKG
jgi:glycosyltransferase involved in cell wall biosynthesis